jgi:hypothetical protein
MNGLTGDERRFGAEQERRQRADAVATAARKAYEDRARGTAS